jgi:hypothetical protein
VIDQRAVVPRARATPMAASAASARDLRSPLAIIGKQSGSSATAGWNRSFSTD